MAGDRSGSCLDGRRLFCEVCAMDAKKVDRRSRFVFVYRMKPEQDMLVNSHGIALLLSWADHSRFFGIAAIAAMLTSRGVVHVEY